MRGNPGSLSVLLAVALLGAVGAAVAGTAEEADAAFAEGRHADALALYDRVLEADAGDVHALLRSGMLLSWSKRFDEALERYDRALDLDPANRAVARERAKVLSWSKRFAEAAAAFRALLEEDPDDREARLGLARSLSWSGGQAAAREEYLALLDRNAADVEARVGLAQTWAWSGRPDRARPEYERALDLDPGNKPARLGLAYLDLATGDRHAAEERAEALVSDHPDDDEVAELGDAVATARAPWIRGSYDRLDDSDDNAVDLWRVETGWGLPRNFDLALGAARWDLSDRVRDARIDSIRVRLGWRASPSHRLEARLGRDRLEGSDGSSDGEAAGGATWTWNAPGEWTGRLDFTREPYRYAPEIVDNRIRIDGWTAAAWGPLSERFSLEAEASRWDLSDDNTRDGAQAGVWYRWPGASVRLQTGYVFRYFAFDRDLDNGYFDPTGFRAHLLGARLRGRFSERTRWGLTVEAGAQSFTRDGVRESGDAVLGVTSELETRLSRRTTLGLYAAHNDYAADSSSGFRSRQLGVWLRRTFGGTR